MFRKVGSIVIVFLAGGIAFINLFLLKYGGGPDHYTYGWHKVYFAVGLGILFGVLAIGERT